MVPNILARDAHSLNEHVVADATQAHGAARPPALERAATPEGAYGFPGTFDTTTQFLPARSASLPTVAMTWLPCDMKLLS